MDNKIQPRESVANSQGEFSEMVTQRRCKLPNNMEIAYQTKVEAEYFYKDIFEKQIYLRHGITLKDGDCVFDVGGNIGLFTLFVHQQQKNLTVYTFEPAPTLFEIMRFNISRNGFNAKLFNCGLSNQTKTATFTFYLKNSGMSSFYADVKEEKKVLRAIMLNQLNQRRQGITGMEQVMQDADDLIDELLEDRFESENYTCQLRTLSDVIAEYHVEQINLLKIDVQKSEWDIITGIKEDDWHKIKQIVMEVHDIEGRLNQILTLLQQHEYQVFVEQDDMCEGSNLYNLFAIKNNLDVSLAEQILTHDKIEPRV